MKVFVLIILVAVLFPPLAASQDCIDYGEYLHWAGGVDTVATKYSIRGRIEPVKLAVTVGSWDFSGKGTLSRRHVRLRLRRFPASCFCKTDQSTLTRQNRSVVTRPRRDSSGDAGRRARAPWSPALCPDPERPASPAHPSQAPDASATHGSTPSTRSTPAADAVRSGRSRDPDILA